MRISAGLTGKNTAIPIDAEMLVRQVRHRVGDDLQVVVGLLLLQAIQEPDEAVQKRLRDTADQLRSLPAFYDRLCSTGEAELVDIAEYLRAVCAQLEAYHAAERRPVRCRLEVNVRPLPLSVASRLGLIVNELVLNGSKQGPGSGGDPYEIYIALHEDADGCLLEVSDSGAGRSPEPERGDAKSLGIRLIQAIVAQLQGMMTIHRDHRTRWTIAFPLPVAAC